MKKSKPFYSIAPLALLSFPLLLSVPQIPMTQLVTDEILEERDVNEGSVTDVKFYPVEDADSTSISESTDAENVLHNLNLNESERQVLASPEFQSQYEDLADKAKKAGAKLPDLKTMIGLFIALAVVGTLGVDGAFGAALKNFFTFGESKTKVLKKVLVTVAEKYTVWKTVNEKVKKLVPRTYEVVKSAVKKVTEKIFTPKQVSVDVVKYEPEGTEFDRMRKSLEVMKKYAKNASPKSQRNFDDSYKSLLDALESLEDVNVSALSGKKKAQYEERKNNLERSLRQTMENLADGLKEDGDKMIQAVNAIVTGKKTVKTTETVMEESTVIKDVPYEYKEYKTEYDEVETEIEKRVPIEMTRDVIEEKTVEEIVTTPTMVALEDKIKVAMRYVNDYSKAYDNPSNGDDFLQLFNSDGAFEDDAKMKSKLVEKIKRAYMDNVHEKHPEQMQAMFKDYNEFIYSLKNKYEKLQTMSSDEERYAYVFGRDYIEDVTSLKKEISDRESQEKSFMQKLDELDEKLRKNEISVREHITLSNLENDRRNQANKGAKAKRKRLAEVVESYERNYATLVHGLKHLSFVRDMDMYRRVHNRDQKTGTLGSSISSSLIADRKPVFTGYSQKALANFVATGGNLATLALKGKVESVIAAKSGVQFASDGSKLTAVNPSAMSTAFAQTEFQTAGVLSFLKKHFTTYKAVPVSSDDFDIKSKINDIDRYVDSLDDKINVQRVKMLHPLLQVSAVAFIKEVKSKLNVDLRIGSEVLRTFEEQNDLYAIGRTKNIDKSVVTRAKGGESYHNYGLAFDVYVLQNGELKSVTNEIATIGKNFGFEWGGDWSIMNDLPHFQMTLGYTPKELLEAGYNDSNYKLIRYKNDQK